jgi:Co/Zn/Cd efflux system component
MMKKSTFLIKKMDCASEEQLIQMKLANDQSIKHLRFNISARQLVIIHEGEVKNISRSISSLKLDSRLIESVTVSEPKINPACQNEKAVLIAVLAINFGLFLVEIITGFISRSMGLVADSLDMLADSIVYGLSLYAVGHAISKKKRIAKISGFFQFFLAFLGFAEVIRRFLGTDQMPVFQAMIIMSLIALSGNIASLIILHKRKDSGAHMKASWIFTSNDVIANLGVILAGILVRLTHSNRPDLIIGTLVFILVARGAHRIIQLSK